MLKQKILNLFKKNFAHLRQMPGPYYLAQEPGVMQENKKFYYFTPYNRIFIFKKLKNGHSNIKAGFGFKNNKY